MNISFSTLQEKPYTVLDGFSKISDHPLTDSSVIVRSGARLLFNWWSDYVERTGHLPTRHSFDILSMLRHASSMFLAARTQNGGWAYQLQGEEFKLLFNGGFQNHVEINCSFAAFHKGVPEYLDTVAESRQCRRAFGSLSDPDRHRNTFEGIDCPLVDHTGRVSHIIGIAELFRAREN